MGLLNLIKKGIVSENPIFVQVIALCPLLAVSNSAINALAMGLATTVVMVCACTVISLLRKIIPGEIRIAAFVVIVAGFVTIIQLLMEAFIPPAINESLGIYIALIVVNCILFARIESFASKNGVAASAADALGMGLGFTSGIFAIGVVREFLGSGSFFGYSLLHDPASHMLIMVMAPGAFFTLGALIMAVRRVRARKGGGGA